MNVVVHDSIVLHDVNYQPSYHMALRVAKKPVEGTAT